MTDRTARGHAAHDQLLVAAFAAGDAEATDRARAQELVGSCPDCAQLAADLRSIAAATAALPAPVRPREFTLRRQDAERLRPRGLRRLAGILGASRLELMRPLAPALTTLGLVGLLASGMPLFTGMSATGGAAPQPEVSRAAGSAAPAAAASPGAAASAAPAASGGPSTDAGTFSAATKVNASPAASEKAGRSLASPQFAVPSASPNSNTAGDAGAAPQDTTLTPTLSVAPPAPAAPGANLPLAAVSAIALLLGLALFGLRRAVRPTAGR